MLSRFIAIFVLAPGFIAPAYAGSIETPTEPRQVRSIDYVGYDGVDTAGNPICRVCEADKAAGAARRMALEERRKRARAYMARMQGQTAGPVDTMPVGALTDEALGDVKLRTRVE
ncbi:hypothetical protein C7477_101244 [Phyllobacterium leguminum]|uniref:Uncharacterized protein n=2 Tax=Phyllobacterium leguminum TaxID=314237 RepID=A0A318T7P4_9HYPH|nr:hypothetical protein C7477_101244 [Phyllobacterium leguminum]